MSIYKSQYFNFKYGVFVLSINTKPSRDKIEIVPAVLAKTAGELSLKVGEVSPFVSGIHIDIMDGEFVLNRTVQPEDMRGFETGLMKEAHLMVKDNGRYVDKILELGFDMIIVHCESCENAYGIIEAVKARGKKIALAVNPQTPISSISGYLDCLDMVLVMTVNPGLSGQDFDYSTVPKIRELRGMREDLDIEVDGGIRVGTARIAAEAGANILVSGSGIYGSADKREAIELLRKDALSALKS